MNRVPPVGLRGVPQGDAVMMLGGRDDESCPGLLEQCGPVIGIKVLCVPR